MAIKEIILERDRSHCSNCKQPMFKGERALYITNEEMSDRVIVHVSCPPGVPKAFSRWRRPKPPPQIKKIEVKCTNCQLVFGAPADKGIPLRCHFCGVVGVCEAARPKAAMGDEG